MMMNISGATSGNGSNSSGRDYSRCPFTQTQWQELEHQALIYKYMLSGVPVPPELIYSIKRSLDSSLASRLFPHQPLGWGCFQVGIGRKADPEPGRCRRTDGKKWRCSKEAYPDSKYCERHMHRGRNRSRKPVESPSPSLSSSSSSSLSSNNSTAIINRPSSNLGSIINTTQVHPPHPPSSSSSSNSSSAAVLSPDIYSYTHQKNLSTATHNLTPLFLSSSHHDPNNSSTTHQLFLESGSHTTHQPEKDYRYYQGIREGVDERTFFPESSSGNVRSFHETMGGTSTATYKGGSGYYSYNQLSQYQSFPDESRRRQQEDQHCFVLGRDFKSSGRQMRIEKGEDDPGDINVDGDDQTQKPLHHFFGEWPPKNTDSWLDLASHSRVDS